MADADPYKTQVSSITARVLLKTTTDHLKASSITTRSMIKTTPAKRSVSSISSRTLTKVKQTGFKATTLNVRNLLRVSPDFRWIDVFSDLVFPHDISEGSDGATRFNTQVNEVASGHDNRISLWDHPLMEYNVAYGVRTMEQLHDLIRFFRVMRGRAMAFRFHDNVDYKSTFAEYEEAREAPDPGPYDQQIGVGDNNALSFQLVKNYGYGEGEQYINTIRPILKPVDGSVLLGVDSQQITWFSCDPSTGIVTIHARLTQQCLAVTLEKADPEAHAGSGVDYTLWKMTVPTYVAPDPTANPPVLQVGTPLPQLVINEWFTTTGLPHEIVRGVVVTSSPTELIFSWPTGAVPVAADPNAQPPVVASPGDAAANLGFVLATDNVPRTGQAVTAGYEFDVPVRFDVDKIPIKLEYYGVGSGNDITLVEVRPEDAQ